MLDGDNRLNNEPEAAQEKLKSKGITRGLEKP